MLGTGACCIESIPAFLGSTALSSGDLSRGRSTVGGQELSEALERSEESSWKAREDPLCVCACAMAMLKKIISMEARTAEHQPRGEQMEVPRGCAR